MGISFVLAGCYNSSRAFCSYLTSEYNLSVEFNQNAESKRKNVESKWENVELLRKNSQFSLKKLSADAKMRA